MAPDTRSGPGTGAATAEQAGQAKIIPPSGTGGVNPVDVEAILAETAARVEQQNRDRPELREIREREAAEKAARRAENARRQAEGVARRAEQDARIEASRRGQAERARRAALRPSLSEKDAQDYAQLRIQLRSHRWKNWQLTTDDVCPIGQFDCPICDDDGAGWVEQYWDDEGAHWRVQCKTCARDRAIRNYEDALGGVIKWRRSGPAEASHLPSEADDESTLDWSWEPEAPEPLIDPVVARGQFVSIVGAKKSGKSLLKLDWAVQLSATEKVLYLDKENPANEVMLRAQDMGVRPTSNLIYRSFPKVGALDTQAGADEFVRSVTASGARVVFIDTWSKFVAGPESAPETHTRAYEMAIIPLRARGITVVAGDHLGKNPKAGPRGGSSKSDNVDVEWTLTVVKVVQAAGDRRPQSVRLVLDHQGIDRTGRCPQTVQLVRLGGSQLASTGPLRHELLVGGDAHPPKVAAVLAALEECGVPPGAGRPTAEKQLREAGHSFTAADLAAALRVRGK